MSTTYDKVKVILEIYPESRNSKEVLVMKYRNHFYGVNITQEQARKIQQSETVNSIIRESTHIQNTEGLFIPNEETRRKRSHQRKLYQTRFSPNKTRQGIYNYS